MPHLPLLGNLSIPHEIHTLGQSYGGSLAQNEIDLIDAENKERSRRIGTCDISTALALVRCPRGLGHDFKTYVALSFLPIRPSPSIPDVGLFKTVTLGPAVSTLAIY